MINVSNIIRKALHVSIFVAVLFPGFAFAESPTITSYTISASSINSAQTISFAWTLTDSGGYSFLIPCVSGVKFKKVDGSVFTCGVPLSTTQAMSDSLILLAYNHSGTTQTILARLTPKNANGTDFPAGFSERTFSVQTMAQPILSFTTSSTDTSSGQPVIVSWTSSILDGVNLQIECNNDIQVSSPTYTAGNSIPCGGMAFANDLAASGSISLSFTNATWGTIPFMIKLFPAVVSKTSYDGSHAVTLSLNIASDAVLDPVVSYFTASTTAVKSGDNITFSWSSRYTKGVNLKFSCNPAIIATSTQHTDQLFPCDAYMFDPILDSVGQTGVSFRNTSREDQTVAIKIVPAKKSGSYDALRGSSLSFVVHPAVIVTSSPLATISPFVSPSSSSSPSPLLSSVPLPSFSSVSSPPAQKKPLFTQLFKRGSSGAQVSALQQYLKRDRVLYPEGVVNGYFGPATERAVQRFQKKYSIVTSGTPSTTGYGTIGAKTRLKLNSLE